MTAIVTSLFVAVACALGFMLIKRLAGNLGKSDQWWFGWALTVMLLGPTVATAVYLSGY